MPLTMPTPWRLSRSAPSPPDPSDLDLDSVLDEFTDRWRRGEAPRAEEYCDRLGPGDESFVELVYREYCLAESSGLDPDPDDYLRRFPAQRDRLGRLFGLHEALDGSVLGPSEGSFADSLADAGPPPLPGPGDEIGPYRLLRELGRGAFARVFLAEESDLDHRLVVVKVSTRRSAEPWLLGRARHPHIVEVLREVSAEDGSLHLVVLPFLGGATLGDLLRVRRRRPRSGRALLDDLDRAGAPEYIEAGDSRPARARLAELSYSRAVAWVVARLAEALDHAHRRGVSHGDIKPSNVLITGDGLPMLLDFNLAVDGRDLGASGDVGGTLAYMAPERLRAVAEPEIGGQFRPADRLRADLYALGLVLVEALTGVPPTVPRRRLSARELAATLAEMRSRPTRLPRSVPSALRPVVARLLQPDRRDRYGRGTDLAADLDAYATGRPTVNAGRSGRLRRPRRVGKEAARGPDRRGPDRRRRALPVPWRWRLRRAARSARRPRRSWRGSGTGPSRAFSASVSRAPGPSIRGPIRASRPPGSSAVTTSSGRTTGDAATTWRASPTTTGPTWRAGSTSRPGGTSMRSARGPTRRPIVAGRWW